MPTLDSTAAAAVAGQAFAPAWFCYLDLLNSGEPDKLRFTTFAANITPTGTGDSDLDSHQYVAWGGSLIDVGEVANSENGSDTLTITLSGIVGMNDSLLAAIGDRANWQGRTARLWFRIYDETGVTPQGAIVAYYTGYMSRLGITAGVNEQTMTLSVENWLAAFNAPSMRSYMNQKDYDSADVSAAATLAAANGLKRDAGATTGTGGGTWGGGVPEGRGLGDPYYSNPLGAGSDTLNQIHNPFIL